MNAKEDAIAERLDEVTRMCARNNPIFEQIDNFSVALYVLGYWDVPDMMSAGDLDPCAASEILKEHFNEIPPSEIPPGYDISQSDEKILMVIGDSCFPLHFAVVTDTTSNKPFFSKLPFVGSGYDSLDELIDEFSVEHNARKQDIRYFKKG